MKRVVRVSVGLVLLILVVACLSQPIIAWSGLEDSSMFPTQDVDEPLVIASNADFESQGWQGNGTNEDPYVIEELLYDGGFGPYINITGVDATFVIRNCEMLSGPVIQLDYGYTSANYMTIRNAQNFTIEGCRFIGGYTHIYVHVSKHVRIHGNTFAQGHGIMCMNVDILNVSENSIEESDFLGVWESGNVIVRNNSILSYVHLLESTYPGMGSGISIDTRQRVEFVSNTVVGEIAFEISSREVVICNNTFLNMTSGISMPHESWYSGVEIVQVEIADNHFDGGGLSFWQHISYPLDIAVIENNYIAGKPILFQREESEKVINCQYYGQVISYICSDVIYSGGTFRNVSIGLMIIDCFNSSISDINFSSCYTGIMLRHSEKTSIERVQVMDCVLGLNAHWSHNMTVSNCLFEQCSKGVTWELCDDGAIVSNVFRENSELGLDLFLCCKATVTSNLFDRNFRNAQDYSYFPNNWDNNTWSDYSGFGVYILFLHDGRIIADHYPRSTLPWYQLPVVIQLISILTLLVLLFTTYMVSKRMDGRLARFFSSRNNVLALLLLIEVLASPVVFSVGKSTVPANTEPESYLMLGSILWRVWVQGTWTYFQGPLSTYPQESWSQLYITSSQILAILLLMAFTLNSWRCQRMGASRLDKRANLLLLLLSAIYLALIYPPAGLPLPVGPVLVYFTSKLVSESPQDTSPSKSPPPDYLRLRCPNCGAVYFYDPSSRANEGAVRCQNCNREFDPNLISKETLDGNYSAEADA
jgi:predicted Zn finger-like uncharacterized protein